MTIKIKAIKIATNNTLVINTLSPSYSWSVVDSQGNTTQILPHMLTNSLSVAADVRFYASYAKSVVSHFVSTEGEEIAVSDYEDEYNKLYSEYDDESEEWSSIDAEYEFKKFRAKWDSVIVKDEIVEQAVIEIIKEVQFETGSKHITSTFVIGGNSSNALYSLNLKAAVREAFFNKMKELGMEQIGSDAGYEMTKDKEVFAIEKDGDMRYTKAFGMYIFSDNYNVDKMSTSRTSNNLSELQTIEKFEVEKMEEFIETAYKKHFLRPMADGLLLATLSKELNTILFSVQRIDYKVSSRSNFGSAVSSIKQLIETVNAAVKKA